MASVTQGLLATGMVTWEALGTCGPGSLFFLHHPLPLPRNSASTREEHPWDGEWGGQALVMSIPAQGPGPSLWADVGSARVQSRFSGSLSEGFKHLLLPCDSQILTEVSLGASEETEEQRGYGICPKSHSTLVAQPDGFSAPGHCACATGSGAVVLNSFPAQALPIKSDPVGVGPGMLIV